MLTPSTIAAQLLEIANIFDSVVPSLGAFGVNPAIIQDINKANGDFRMAIQAFAEADKADAPSIIQRIQDDAMAVLLALGSAPLPYPAVVALTVAQMLLPGLIAVARLIFAAK
jgi:hypothetical protein